MRPSLAASLRRLSRIVPLAAFLALLGMVALWGVDLPHWDQLELAPLVVDLHRGELELADLVRKHNEHSLFFPKLAMLGLAAATGWNVRAELFAMVALAGVVFWAIAFAARRSAPEVPAGSPRRAAFTIAAALLVFSPNQWENWVWGWQVQILLSVAAAVWGLVVLWRWPRRIPAVFVAGACAAIATFSYGNALVVWPLGVLLLVPRTRGRRLSLAVYSAIAVASCGLFFSIDSPAPGLSIPAGPGRLAGAASYFARWLGAAAWGAADGRLAAVAGGLALAAWAALGVSALRRDGAPWRTRAARTVGSGSPGRGPDLWIAFGAYAVLSGLAIALGRSETFPDSAVTPRYWTVSNFLWISLLALWLLRPPARSRRAVAAAWALVLLLAPGWIHGSVRGAVFARGQYLHRVPIRRSLLEDRFTELAAGHMYPDRAVLRNRLLDLCRHRLSVFREAGPSFACALAEEPPEDPTEPPPPGR